MGIKEDFIVRYAPCALKAARATGFPADILLAHAALETGWGRHVPENKSIVASFEDFESPLDSMICYIGLLRTLPRYRKAWNHAIKGEAIEFFHALQKAGYATDPLYASKLIAVWKSLPKNWLEIAAKAKARER